MKDFFSQIISGKTLGRFLQNEQIKKHVGIIHGSVIDLAGGGSASYYRFLSKETKILRTNYLLGPEVDVVVDLNDALPFETERFDTVLFFNALYLIRDDAKLMKEIHRVLAPGGTVLIANPFLYSEMPEPDDFRRLTKQGLEKLFSEAGFQKFHCIPYGERFSSASNLLHPFWLFPILRIPIYALAIVLDKYIPDSIKKRHPSPLGYFCVVSK